DPRPLQGHLRPRQFRRAGDLSAPVRRRPCLPGADWRGPARHRRGDHGAPAGQARIEHLAAVRRREGDDRGGPGVRDLPAQPGAVLPARRRRCAAGRGQRRPLQRDGHRDEREGAVPVRHPQQGDDGGREAAFRRYHARARRQPAGVGGPCGSRAPGRRRLRTHTESTMSDTWMLRIGILVVGALLFAAIWYFGTRPRSPQGRRVPKTAAAREERMEPTLGAQLERELGDGDAGGAPAGESVQAEMELLDGAVGGTAGATVSQYGQRVSDEFDKIVTLYIAARAGNVLRGPDIAVAAEKAGMTYGHLNVFHRLVNGHPERGPMFSV